MGVVYTVHGLYRILRGRYQEFLVFTSKHFAPINFDHPSCFNFMHL